MLWKLYKLILNILFVNFGFLVCRMGIALPHSAALSIKFGKTYGKGPAQHKCSTSICKKKKWHLGDIQWITVPHPPTSREDREQGEEGKRKMYFYQYSFRLQGWGWGLPSKVCRIQADQVSDTQVLCTSHSEGGFCVPSPWLQMSLWLRQPTEWLLKLGCKDHAALPGSLGHLLHGKMGEVPLPSVALLQRPPMGPPSYSPSWASRKHQPHPR